MVWVREINVRGPAGTVDVNDPDVMAAVQDAIDNMLASENVLRAYPKGVVQQTGLDSVPFQWTYQTLSAPVPELVTETVEGTWQGTERRRGNVPILRADGTLRDAQIPDSVARKSDIPEPTPPVDPVAARRVVSPNVPIFAARLAVARATNAPCAVVFAGSSSTGILPGYVEPLGKLLQEAFPVDDQSTIQKSPSADFTRVTTPGVHSYTAAEGGTTADTFLTDAECDKIAALDPALVHIMVGSNDFKLGVSPATYKAQLSTRLDYLAGAISGPVQFVLAHQYERMDNPGGAYEWSEYRQALEETAAARTDAVVVDLSGAFAATGIPSSDPLDLIDTDLIHQTTRGYLFMTDLFAAFYFAT